MPRNLDPDLKKEIQEAATLILDTIRLNDMDWSIAVHAMLNMVIKTLSERSPPERDDEILEDLRHALDHYRKELMEKSPMS